MFSLLVCNVISDQLEQISLFFVSTRDPDPVDQNAKAPAGCWDHWDALIKKGEVEKMRVNHT